MTENTKIFNPSLWKAYGMGGEGLPVVY